MKIEIEWSASYEANVKIQEQEYRVDLLPEPKVTPLHGAPDMAHGFSFASVMMMQLAPMIFGLMQAEAITDDYGDPSGDTDNTFRSVPDYIALAVQEKIKSYTK
jgi:hypothetical protein